MRRAIIGFTQSPGELIHESWERLKELLRKCPHRGLSKWQIVQAFYEGLTKQYRQMVNASCGGAFMSKSEDEAYDLFEMLSENSINHVSLSSYERSIGTSKRAGVYEVRNRAESELRMDINAITHTMDLMAQKLDQILALKAQEPMVQLKTSPFSPMAQSPQESCNLCASLTHNMSDRPTATQLPTCI